jgi:hypothetical protein
MEYLVDQWFRTLPFNVSESTQDITKQYAVRVLAVSGHVMFITEARAFPAGRLGVRCTGCACAVFATHEFALDRTVHDGHRLCGVHTW